MPVESDADRRHFLSPEEFGREVFYTPAGGAARTVAVLDDWQALDLMADDSAGVEADSLRLLALASDLPDTSRAARVLVDGVSYRIASAKPDGTGFVLIALVEA